MCWSPSARASGEVSATSVCPHSLHIHRYRSHAGSSPVLSLRSVCTSIVGCSAILPIASSARDEEIKYQCISRRSGAAQRDPRADPPRPRRTVAAARSWALSVRRDTSWAEIRSRSEPLCSSRARWPARSTATSRTASRSTAPAAKASTRALSRTVDTHQHRARRWRGRSGAGPLRRRHHPLLSASPCAVAVLSPHALPTRRSADLGIVARLRRVADHGESRRTDLSAQAGLWVGQRRAGPTAGRLPAEPAPHDEDPGSADHRAFATTAHPPASRAAAHRWRRRAACR